MSKRHFFVVGIGVVAVMWLFMSQMQIMQRTPSLQFAMNNTDDSSLVLMERVFKLEQQLEKSNDENIRLVRWFSRHGGTEDKAVSQTDPPIVAAQAKELENLKAALTDAKQKLAEEMERAVPEPKPAPAEAEKPAAAAPATEPTAASGHAALLREFSTALSNISSTYRGAITPTVSFRGDESAGLLKALRKLLAGEDVHIVAQGGSSTAGGGGVGTHGVYLETVGDELNAMLRTAEADGRDGKKYGKVVTHNMAHGSTTSMWAANVLDSISPTGREPDIIIWEFSINDPELVENIDLSLWVKVANLTFNAGLIEYSLQAWLRRVMGKQYTTPPPVLMAYLWDPGSGDDSCFFEPRCPDVPRSAAQSKTSLLHLVKESCGKLDFTDWDVIERSAVCANQPFAQTNTDKPKQCHDKCAQDSRCNYYRVDTKAFPTPTPCFLWEKCEGLRAATDSDTVILGRPTAEHTGPFQHLEPIPKNCCEKAPCCIRHNISLPTTTAYDSQIPLVKKYIAAGFDLGVVNLWEMANALDTNRCHVLVDFHHPNRKWHGILADTLLHQMLAVFQKELQAQSAAVAVASKARPDLIAVDSALLVDRTIVPGQGHCPRDIMLTQLEHATVAASWVGSPPRAGRQFRGLQFSLKSASEGKFGKADSRRADRQEGVRIPCCHKEQMVFTLGNGTDSAKYAVNGLTWHINYQVFGHDKAQGRKTWTADTPNLKEGLIGIGKNAGGKLSGVKHVIKHRPKPGSTEWSEANLGKTDVPKQCFLGLDGIGMPCKFVGACSEWWLPNAKFPAAELQWSICQDCGGKDPDSTELIRSFLIWASASMVEQ